MDVCTVLEHPNIICKAMRYYYIIPHGCLYHLPVSSLMEAAQAPASDTTRLIVVSTLPAEVVSSFGSSSTNELDQLQ